MKRLITNAFLLRKVDGRRDADVLLTLFTEDHGILTAIAYSAKSSRKRFSVIEPFHTLRVEVDEAKEGELGVLRNAVVYEARTGYLSNLERMEAASVALGWVRRSLPPGAPETALWALLSAFLDTAITCQRDDLQAELAAFGLNMLRGIGWAPPPSRVRPGMDALAVLRVVEDTIRTHVNG